MHPFPFAYLVCRMDVAQIEQPGTANKWGARVIQQCLYLIRKKADLTNQKSSYTDWKEIMEGNQYIATYMYLVFLQLHCEEFVQATEQSGRGS